MEREREMEREIPAAITRKEKRKALKKLKRQQLRRQLAIRAKEQENDPQEQLRLLQLEEEERQRSQRERNLFEESERRWSHKANQLQLQLQLQLQHHQNKEDHSDKEDHAPWDYVQAGPAQIIWRGNEIILKKTTIQLPKSHAHTTTNDQDAERPTSNPLPPQSQPLSSHFHMSTLPTHDVLNKMAQETPNFGTEQDKAHCPFHLKTGVCRFGLRCNRVHLYPEKSCTLLIKNMYSGPGLAWELDEGLECTDEEVEHSYEEFYEDVHTEFLKFGELVNFKVCRNSSYHLRGNVYVHYKSLDSAVFAYESINGRYFAGKQIICDFVSVTRWKVAICGEYMKSRLKSCSRGSACNFLHCFRNPGGDYEWADWDKPPPKYWINKMISLFGFSDQSYYDNKATELGDVENSRSSDLKGTPSSDSRYDSRRKKERHDCHFVSDDSDIERGNRKRRRNTSKSEKHQTHDSDRHHSTRKRSHDERLGSISRKHKERRNREYHTEEGNDITESKRRHQNKEPREVSKGSFSEEEEADVRREKSKRHRDDYSDNVSDNKSRRKHSTTMKRRQRKKHGEDASEEANYDVYSNSR